ncbi:MAG: ABC transporter ATP-binding protein [Pseudomonadota bacterium]
MNTESPILEIRNLQVGRGGATVLDISRLSLSTGEVLCLIGPNGAGKSTFLLTLARLLKSFTGEIVFKGQRIESNNAILTYRRKLSMVFQEPLLFDTTVFENVVSGLKIRGMRQDEIKHAAALCLDRFGIGHIAGRSARKLSGGEAQRTSLARAFAIKPEIIFLDEPFSSLDPPTRESLIEDLDRVLRETGTTTIMATHDQMEVLRLSDRIAVMNQGKIAQIGTPEAVMNNPADEFVASFVGVETILNGEIIRTDAGTVICRVQNGEIEAVGNAKPGERVVCCIRPEHVTLSTGPSQEGVSARNTFPGRIVRISPMGLFYKVSVDCGFFLTAYVTIPSAESLALEEGKPIFASFKATAVHLIRRSVPG